jgi:hypothetical protein
MIKSRIEISLSDLAKTKIKSKPRPNEPKAKKKRDNKYPKLNNPRKKYKKLKINLALIQKNFYYSQELVIVHCVIFHLIAIFVAQITR